MATIPRKGLWRFERFPWYAQVIYLHPWIRRYVLPALPALIGLWVGAVGAAYITPELMLFSLFGLAGSAAYIYYYLDLDAVKESKEGVPQFGMHEFFGVRLPEIFDEGAVMKMPGTRILLRSKEKFNEDVTFNNVRCRLDSIADGEDKNFLDVIAEALNTPSPADIKIGGAVEITVGLTFERQWMDGWDMLDYDDLGETKGFLEIITDDIEDDMKEIGRRLTWYQFGFATDLASAALISKLTGVTEFKYQGKEKKLFDNPTPDFIRAFLIAVQKNGLSYIHGTGVKIFRARLKSVDPIGKLKSEAETAAVEHMRREGLLANVDALTSAAQKLESAINDGSMTMKDIIHTIQVDDKDARVEKKIIEIAGGDIDKLAETIKQILTHWKGTS